MKEVTRVKYVMKKFLIDKKSINEFYINEEERRQIKSGRVASLRVLLDSGGHFDSPFVCNLWKGKWRVVDANHRAEAIADELDKNPDFKIEVWIAEYKSDDSKTIDEVREFERKIYSKWNSGMQESGTDYLQQHFKVIPLGEQMLKLLPVRVYGDSKHYKMKTLIGSYLMAKKQGKFVGGYDKGGESIVKDFSEIESEDIRTIRAWYNDMTEIFGQFTHTNPFYKTTATVIFWRIWYDNRTNVPRQKFIELMKNVFTKNPSQWDQYTKSGSRVTQQIFYGVALDTLNRISTKYKFLSDSDILAKSSNKQVQEIEDMIGE